MKTADQKAMIPQAQSRLLDWLTPSTTVYGLMQVSGQSRRVRLFIILDGRIQEITGTVSIATNQKRDSHDRIIVTGTGFNAVAHCVEYIENALCITLRSEYL